VIIEILPTEPYYASLTPLTDNDVRVRAAFDEAGRMANEIGKPVHVMLAGQIIGGAHPKS
jgi:hypothetical protein